VCLQDSCEMYAGFFAVRIYKIQITATNLKALTCKQRKINYRIRQEIPERPQAFCYQYLRIHRPPYHRQLTKPSVINIYVHTALHIISN
jgi:hypothetical protein